MTFPGRHLVPLLLLLAACPWCAAQVQVSFPLQGYYRPGKYVPVRVVATETGAPVVLRAEGAVPVAIEPGAGGINAVVPWLAADRVQAPRWEIAGVGEGFIDATMTPLEPRQVLVGIVGADERAAAAAVDLFPGRSVVAIPLTGTPPLPGDPAAWEVLDAVVFDEPDDAVLDQLLAQGVLVVSRSNARPGGRWAWQGGPGRWFVRVNPAGPSGAIHPTAYTPVASWRPGWPPALRRRAVLLALVFCLVAAATTLWRRTRLATLAAVAASAAAAAGFAWWGARQPMVCEATTGVTVSGPAVQQRDGWSYHRPLRPRDVSVDWLRLSKPVFGSARHLRETDVELRVTAAGRPLRFAWRARPGTTLAFLRRSYSPSDVQPGPVASSPPPSPIRELVLESYLRPDDVILHDPGDPSPPDNAALWGADWPHVTVYRTGE